MGVPKIWLPNSSMVYFMENPKIKWMILGYPYFRKLLYYIYKKEWSYTALFCSINHHQRSHVKMLTGLGCVPMIYLVLVLFLLLVCLCHGKRPSRQEIPNSVGGVKGECIIMLMMMLIKNMMMAFNVDDGAAADDDDAAAGDADDNNVDGDGDDSDDIDDGGDDDGGDDDDDDDEDDGDDDVEEKDVEEEDRSQDGEALRASRRSRNADGHCTRAIL